MSKTKQTTVTTIETHEVWIIRNVVPEQSDEAATLLPTEIAQLPVSTLSELNNSSHTIEEEEP